MNQKELNLLNRISHECLLSLGGRKLNACFQTGILNDDEGQAGENIHSHLQYEVHYGGSEGYDVIIERDIHRLKPKELLLLAPGVYHTCLPSENRAGKRSFYYYFMTPDKSGITSPLDFHSGYRLAYDDFGFPDIFDKILLEFIAEKSGYAEKVAHQISCLLIDLSRATNEDKKADRVDLTSGKSQIGILDRFFTLQYNSNPKKTELAGQLSISERQLERILYETYGMTFKQKVQKTRFDTANYYLNNLGYPPGIVAGLIGYSSENSFYFAYKKYFGITPSQYLFQMNSTSPRRNR